MNEHNEPMSNDSFDRFSNFIPTTSGNRADDPADSSTYHALLGEDNLDVGERSFSQGGSARAESEDLSTPSHDDADGSSAIRPPLPAIALQNPAPELASTPRADVLQEPSTIRWPGQRAGGINKVTWAQVGNVTEPGHYALQFGSLAISVEDLAIWRQFPNASFTLCQTGQASASEYRLGAFDPGRPDEG